MSVYKASACNIRGYLWPDHKQGQDVDLQLYVWQLENRECLDKRQLCTERFSNISQHVLLDLLAFGYTKTCLKEHTHSCHFIKHSYSLHCRQYCRLYSNLKFHKKIRSNLNERSSSVTISFLWSEGKLNSKRPKLSSELHDDNIQDASWYINLLKPTGYVMHQQFNIQQLYVLPTPYLCVSYLSENKQRLVPLTA